MQGIIFFILVLTIVSAFAREFLVVGTGNREKPGAVYVCEFNDGKLLAPRKVLDLSRKVQVEPNGEKNRLYVSAGANKGDDSGLLIALRNTDSGKLERLNQLDSGVSHFCSMVVSPDGRYLLGASYDDGVVGCFSLKPDGALNEATSRLELPKVAGKRKPMARAHDVEISKDGNLVFVADIYSNRIYTLGLDQSTGELTRIGHTESKNFEGPRHLILSEDEKTFYLLNQKGSSIVAFRHDGKGVLTELQSISTLPPGYSGPQNHSAEILIHSSGKFLYVSNRIHDSLVVFGIAPSGALTKIQSIPSGGKNPWSFVFDARGEFLICSNLKSNNLVVFRIDQETGKLEQLEGTLEVPEPISLTMMSGD